MESPSRPRSTRDRPAKPPLSEDVILDVALRILRDEGLEAVTMRRLASELDTGPASLYVYISGRNELREALFDRVAGTVVLQEPDPTRWRQQVHSLMYGLVAAMVAHPGIATVAVGNPPTGERAVLVAENLLGVLRAGGVRDRDAAWACDILPLLATASAIEAAVHQQRADAGEADSEFVERLAEAFSTLPPTRFPNITALGGEMISGDGDERFRFAIDVFLDGLAARSARSARSAR
jgi:AcrR family transcriptional regulator